MQHVTMNFFALDLLLLANSQFSNYSSSIISCECKIWKWMVIWCNMHVRGAYALYRSLKFHPVILYCRSCLQWPSLLPSWLASQTGTRATIVSKLCWDAGWIGRFTWNSVLNRRMCITSMALLCCNIGQKRALWFGETSVTFG